MTADRDWRRLHDLLAAAREQVVLIAPFIKLDVFQDLIASVPAEVPAITCITRWSAAEIAAGVSDPEIIDLIRADARLSIRLNPLLHAKIYIADGRCLVGSANLTNRALGRRTPRNVEVLIDVEAAEPSVVEAVAEARAGSVAATEDLARQLRAQAESLTRLYQDADFVAARQQGDLEEWLPETRDPSRLLPVYQGKQVDFPSAVLDGVLRDLFALDISAGLDEEGFRRAVAHRLREMRAIEEFVTTGRMQSSALIATIVDLRAYDEQTANRQAVILAEWLQYFDNVTLQPFGEWELRSTVPRPRPRG